MRKAIFLLSMLLAVFNAISQSNSNKVIDQIKLYYFNNGIAIGEKEIFYNNSENIIELDGYQIPLNEVKVVYNYNDSLPGFYHFVYYECKQDKNCIKSKNDEYVFGFSVPFRSKEACYEFINLISNLK